MKKLHYFGVLVGFVSSLLLRLLGGEYYLSFPAVIAWPWYAREYNLQHFPFRTVCMLIGLLVNVAVSYLLHWLFTSGRLPDKYDVLNAVVNDCNDDLATTHHMGENGIDNYAMETQS